MKKVIAILLGFLAFGLVGYVGGQAQNEQSGQSEAIRQLELRIEQLERNQANWSNCCCIGAPKRSGEIEIGGIRFYVVPVAGGAGKGGPK